MITVVKALVPADEGACVLVSAPARQLGQLHPVPRGQAELPRLTQRGDYCEQTGEYCEQMGDYFEKMGDYCKQMGN